jgi:hypothetical protein
MLYLSGKLVDDAFFTLASAVMIKMVRTASFNSQQKLKNLLKRTLTFCFVLMQFAAIASAQIHIQSRQLLTDKAKDVIVVPQIATNTQTGETLVYWTKYFAPPALQARIVDANGKTISAQLDLIEDGWSVAPDEVTPVSMVYNPVDNEYLLAYSGSTASEPENFYIFVKRFDASGKPIGAPINVSHDPLTDPFNNNLSPYVYFNPKNGGYILYWFVHAVNDIQGDSFEAKLFLDKQGNRSGPLQKITCCRAEGSGATCSCSIYYTGAYLPNGKKEMLFDLSVNQDSAYYEFAIVNPLLINLNPPFVTVNQQPSVDPIPGTKNLSIWNISPVFLPDGSGFLYYVDTTGIKAQKFDIHGKLSGSSFVAFNPPKQNTSLYWPSAALVTTAKGVRGVLVAAEDQLLDGDASLWAQTLDANGRPLGTPIKIYVAPSKTTMKETLMTALPSTPADTSFQFVVYGTVANVPPYGVPLGNQVVKINLSLKP